MVTRLSWREKILETNMALKQVDIMFVSDDAVQTVIGNTKPLIRNHKVSSENTRKRKSESLKEEGEMPSSLGSAKKKTVHANREKESKTERGVTAKSSGEDNNEGGSSRRRKSVYQPVQKIIAETNQRCSSSESEYETSEDDSPSETDQDITFSSSIAIKTPRKSNSVRKQPSKSGKGRDSDAYFLAQYGRRVTTSDKTLSSVKAAKMDPETLRYYMESSCTKHKKECNNLYQSYTKMFGKWMFQLRHGFNCLLYGLGSKSKLMDKFRKECLTAENHIVVNGFFPGLTIKQILNTITDDVLNHTGTFKSVIDQAMFIKNEFDADDALELFLLVYNIDGAMLRSSKVQDALSFIATAAKIHILASIDHINAPLIWDQTKSSRFNWLWYDVTTFEPYIKEMSFENSFLIQQSGSLALSSLIHVIKSLTPNAKGIFVLLANYQLDNENDGAFQGLSFNDLYQKCRERFLVSSDLTLRAQLTEFRDHKLIKSKKGQDGVEYLTIPLDSSSLRDFLDDEAA